jgi:hypothetical protein
MPTVERIEDGDPIGTEHYRLAVHCERPAAELARGGRDRRIAICPIIAAAREMGER